jgi:hypothetical protein
VKRSPEHIFNKTLPTNCGNEYLVSTSSDLNAARVGVISLSITVLVNPQRRSKETDSYLAGTFGCCDDVWNQIRKEKEKTTNIKRKNKETDKRNIQHLHIDLLNVEEHY